MQGAAVPDADWSLAFAVRIGQLDSLYLICSSADGFDQSRYQAEQCLLAHRAHMAGPRNLELFVSAPAALLELPPERLLFAARLRKLTCPSLPCFFVFSSTSVICEQNPSKVLPLMK